MTGADDPRRPGTGRAPARCRPARALAGKARRWLGLGVTAALAGCAFTVPEPVLVREPRPEPVPLRIGVHYPADFRGFHYRHHLTDTAYVLGTPSVRLLGEALSLLFVEVVESPRPAAGVALRDGVAGVIEPRIASAGYSYPPTGITYFPTHVTYGLTLYSPAGAPIAAWSVTGQGNEPVGTPPFNAVAIIKRSFEQAMREAALKLTSGFREVPELRRWLDAQGVR
jgi:hypothetical protein